MKEESDTQIRAPGAEVPDYEPVDVADLARHVCVAAHLSPDIVAAEPGSASWALDRRRFTQILANLLDNAARYGGGAVAIGIHCTGVDGVVDVDDGPGVAPADRQAIFNRFMRGPTAGARADRDGTGLGLAIVADHASAHGGTVEALDRHGGGARFRVRIPRERRP